MYFLRYCRSFYIRFRTALSSNGSFSRPAGPEQHSLFPILLLAPPITILNNMLISNVDVIKLPIQITQPFPLFLPFFLHLPSFFSFLYHQTKNTSLIVEQNTPFLVSNWYIVKKIEHI